MSNKAVTVSSKHTKPMNELEELMKERIELEHLKMEVLKTQIQLMEKELELSQRKQQSENKHRRSMDRVQATASSPSKPKRENNGIWNWNLE